MEQKGVTVRGVRCSRCGQLIYSRARHDFHWCKCKTVAIDGGFDYVKVVGYGKIEDVYIPDMTKGMLYDDWNMAKDKYGWID